MSTPAHASRTRLWIDNIRLDESMTAPRSGADCRLYFIEIGAVPGGKIIEPTTR
jgi:hypothetical protein